MTNVWDFMAWLNLALAATLFGWWAIGDFTRVYWLPLLNRKDWMMEPRWMQFFWAVAYILLNISTFIIWSNEGGWEDRPGPLFLSVLTTFLGCVWHYVLYWTHCIQLSFYAAFLTAIAGLITTIWFFFLDAVQGVFALIVLIWLIYIVGWSYTLTTSNMKPDGRVSKTGARPSMVFQTVGAGLPQPQQWTEAGRRCPYEKSYNKAVKTSGYSSHPV